jgi:hypothetical protein
LHFGAESAANDGDGRSGNKAVDLIAVVTRQLGKSNIEPHSELMIANYSGSTHLVTVWQAKSERHRRPGNIGNETLHKRPLGGKSKDAAIPRASVRFAPGAQRVFALSSVPG